MKRSLKNDLFNINITLPGYFCKNKQHEICCAIVERGDFKLLRYAREKQNYTWTNNILDPIIQSGSMPIFYYCIGSITDIRHPELIYNLLAKHNRYEMTINLVSRNLLPKSEHLLAASSYHGRLDLIKYAIYNNHEKSSYALRNAIEAENLDIIKVLLEHDVPYDISCMNMAIRKKNLRIIEYLLHRIVSFKEELYIPNNVEVARYLKENGCQIHPLLCLYASHDNDFELLKYAYENGSTLMDPKNMIYAIEYENYDMIDYIYEKTGKLTVETFSQSRSRKMVEYLIQKNPLLLEHRDSYIRYSFINSGKIELIQWLVENKFEIPNDICEITIVTSKCRNTLSYLHEKGYPLTRRCYSLCARYGDIEMMKYLLEKNCDWDINIFLESIKNIDNYHFVRKHCPLSDTDFLYRASLSNYNKNVLQDLCLKKEPLNSYIFPEIIRNKWAHAYTPYLFQNQAPYIRDDVNKLVSIFINTKNGSLLYHLSKYVKLTPRQMKHVTRYTRRFSFLEQHLVKDLVGMVIDYL